MSLPNHRPEISSTPRLSNTPSLRLNEYGKQLSCTVSPDTCPAGRERCLTAFSQVQHPTGPDQQLLELVCSQVKVASSCMTTALLAAALSAFYS